MNVIIWSKNRPAQLDLLLRSIEKYWDGYENNTYNIIYKYDNNEFKMGYDIVKNEWSYSNINYITESDFKEDVINCIDSNRLTAFFCDDDIFKSAYIQDDSIMNNSEIACISLRLGDHITEHYIKGVCSVPERINGLWNWRNKDIDWGYPMSAGSGHIFRTEDLIPILTDSEYISPTDLEDVLNANKLPQSKMFCYDNSSVMNLAINRVQTKRDTLCGEIGATELNDKFLAGHRIKLEPFHNYVNKSAHIITEVEYD